MLNFTVGPVQEPDCVLQIGAQQTPYFRTASFSEVMLQNEAMIKTLAYAPEEARAVFLTASGTGAMEAAVINAFTAEDKVLIVNGGSFGQRFVQICDIHGIPYQEIIVPFEENLTAELLAPYENKGYTGFLINMHETSIGKLYDMQLVSDFCRRNKLFLVVDAISAFLADPFHMEQLSVDIMIASSQKALAVPPGISILLLSPSAVARVQRKKVQSLYFDLANALTNMERGQTPFTPAVGTLLQIHARLQQLVQMGVEQENRRIAGLAEHFRRGIQGLPLKIAGDSLSNAVTPLLTEGISAYRLFEKLETDYQIWICPSGGELRDSLFRVGHLGNLTIEDNQRLLGALREVLLWQNEL
jgi:aspartate aminotransferase-like enzyme